MYVILSTTSQHGSKDPVWKEASHEACCERSPRTDKHYAHRCDGDQPTSSGDPLIAPSRLLPGVGLGGTSSWSRKDCVKLFEHVRAERDLKRAETPDKLFDRAGTE